MFGDHSYLVALVTIAATALPTSDCAHTVAADRFVDATGVNIHLHYDHSAYRTQFPLIKSRLLELGVRHVRDGLEDTVWQGYYDRHNELGDAGIRGTFIVSPEQSTELWAAYPARVSRSFEAYEAPNEYDISRDPNWVPVLTETLRRLGGLRTVNSLRVYPVYGPSLTSEAAYVALGNVSGYFDFSNLHNYFAGRHPGTPGWGEGGYGGIPWNLALAYQYGGGKPMVTTETGYPDSAAATEPVPPEIAGRYMPRLLLEHYLAGFTRTFLYELCDYPKSSGFGLLYADGSPKPAFTAVKSLLNLLTDPGPSFTPRELSYTLEGSTNDLRHISFQKRNGTYYLALWLSVPGWDPIDREVLEPEPQDVTVTFPSPMRILRTHRWQPDGSIVAESSSATTATMSVAVTDTLMIVEMARR